MSSLKIKMNDYKLNTYATSSNILEQLIKALRYLPGVGPRSAERLAYYLLQSKERSQYLAHTLQNALDKIQQCSLCNHYSQETICPRCSDNKRNKQLLCIVETPQDLLAIEQSSAYKGLFYVLMGRISPLDGIGPDELNLAKLLKIMQQNSITEVILALSPTVEGQTTSHYLQALLAPLKLKLTQLAQGIPLGSDLASLDSITIANAISNRLVLQPHLD